MSAALSCPKCKAPLEAHQVKPGVVVQHCPACFGVLYGADDLAVEVGWTPVKPSARVCPVCATTMEIATAYGGQLETDRCPGCGAVWFDAGEIQILRRLSGVDEIAGRRRAVPPKRDAGAAPVAGAPAPAPPAGAPPAELPKVQKAAGPKDMSEQSNPDADLAPVARLDGVSYRHFQTSVPTTVSVLGEFPWIAEVGDTARMRDFVAPPMLLSQEITDSESVWTRGEYLEPEEVWAGFALPGAPPPRAGVGPCQPNPWEGKKAGVWALSLTAAAVVLGVFVLSWQSSSRAAVWEGNFEFSALDAERSRVSPAFELVGRPDNVAITIDANLSNDWAYFSLALIDEETGRAYDFGRELSYYSGVDDGEAWSEGSRWETFVVPGIPPGRYYLRIEQADGARSVAARVLVRRGVPLARVPLIAIALLMVAPLWASMRSAAFESSRWTESDHPPVTDSEDWEDE